MNAVVETKLNSFFAKYKQRTYKKGEFLIWPREDLSDIYFLKSGIVTEYVISQKGSEAILAFYSPREIFPLSLIDNTVNTHYFEALFQCVAYRAPYEDFIKFAQANTDVLLYLLKQTNREMDDLKVRMAYGMASDAYLKLVQEILLIAKYVGTKDEKTGHTTIRHFIGRYAAARTGLTVETVSREMKKLKSKKLVDFRRNVLTILDMKLLEDELDDY